MGNVCLLCTGFGLATVFNGGMTKGARRKLAGDKKKSGRVLAKEVSPPKQKKCLLLVPVRQGTLREAVGDVDDCTWDEYTGDGIPG